MAGPWLNVSVRTERIMQRSSATLAVWGSSSDTSRPESPCLANFHGDPLILGSASLIMANLWSLMTDLGIGSPSRFSSRGLGSKRSMWEGPPDMNREMTRLARGA